MRKHGSAVPSSRLSASAGDNATRTPARAQAIPSTTRRLRFYFTARHVQALDAIAEVFRAEGRLSQYLPASALARRIADMLDENGSGGLAPAELFTFGDIGRLMSWTQPARVHSIDLAAELRDAARVIWEALTGSPGGFPFTRVEDSGALRRCAVCGAPSIGAVCVSAISCQERIALSRAGGR